MYRRADLSRTFVLVVSLLLTAVSTGASAREFYALFNAEQAEIGATGFDRTIVALIGPVTPLLVCRHRKTERI